jgi:hypothetical protein
VDGLGGGEEGRGQARITHISLSLSPILSDGVGWWGGGGGEGRGGDRHALLTSLSLSLSPILSDDILDSIKPAL